MTRATARSVSSFELAEYCDRIKLSISHKGESGGGGSLPVRVRPGFAAAP
jgi:hypothetical protein